MNRGGTSSSDTNRLLECVQDSIAYLRGINDKKKNSGPSDAPQPQPSQSQSHGSYYSSTNQPANLSWAPGYDANNEVEEEEEEIPLESMRDHYKDWYAPQPDVTAPALPTNMSEPANLPKRKRVRSKKKKKLPNSGPGGANFGSQEQQYFVPKVIDYSHAGSSRPQGAGPPQNYGQYSDPAEDMLFERRVEPQRDAKYQISLARQRQEQELQKILNAKIMEDRLREEELRQKEKEAKMKKLEDEIRVARTLRQQVFQEHGRGGTNPPPQPEEIKIEDESDSDDDSIISLDSETTGRSYPTSGTPKDERVNRDPRQRPEQKKTAKDPGPRKRLPQDQKSKDADSSKSKLDALLDMLPSRKDLDSLSGFAKRPRQEVAQPSSEYDLRPQNEDSLRRNVDQLFNTGRPPLRSDPEEAGNVDALRENVSKLFSTGNVSQISDPSSQGFGSQRPRSPSGSSHSPRPHSPHNPTSLGVLPLEEAGEQLFHCSKCKVVLPSVEKLLVHRGKPCTDSVKAKCKINHDHQEINVVFKSNAEAMDFIRNHHLDHYFVAKTFEEENKLYHCEMKDKKAKCKANFSIYSEYLCLCDLDLNRQYGASRDHCTKREKLFSIMGCLTHNHAVEEVPVLASPDQKATLIEIISENKMGASEIVNTCMKRPDFLGSRINVNYIMTLKRAYPSTKPGALPHPMASGKDPTAKTDQNQKLVSSLLAMLPGQDQVGSHHPNSSQGRPSGAFQDLQQSPPRGQPQRQGRDLYSPSDPQRVSAGSPPRGHPYQNPQQSLQEPAYDAPPRGFGSSYSSHPPDGHSFHDSRPQHQPSGNSHYNNATSVRPMASSWEDFSVPRINAFPNQEAGNRGPMLTSKIPLSITKIDDILDHLKSNKPIKDKKQVIMGLQKLLSSIERK